MIKKNITPKQKVTSDELRTVFIDVLKDTVSNHKKVALMLSGGIDSASILYGLLELNVEVVPYTFYLKDHESKDLSSSQDLSDKYGLDLTVVEVPVDNILDDFKKLYLDYNCYRKTQFETKIHYLYLFPQIKEQILLGGIEADNHQGTVKSMILKGRKNPLVFDELRQKAYKYATEVNLPIDYQLAKENNVKLVYPFADKRVYDFYLQFDWGYLNKPYAKWVLINAFKEYFEKDGYRNHIDLQQASKLKEYCQRFVDNPLINVNNKKSVVGVYNDLMRKWSVEKTE